MDRIVAAWRRERPDLDVSPLEVLSRVTRLAQHLDRARRATFDAHGLESGEFDVLSALRRAGPPHELSPGRLLAQTLVTSGTTTHRVDRLVVRSLVTRRADEHDRRGVLVRLTDAGLAVVDAAMVDLLAQERSLLRGLDPERRARLADALRVLVAPLDGRVPVSGRPGPERAG